MSEQTPKVGIVNIANWLTLIRILLVPVMLWALFAHDGMNSWWRALAWFIFAIAAFTDRLDGELARKRGIGTDLGALLDPIADKALIGAGLIGLSILGDVWWWVTIVIMVREIGITLLRFTVISKKVIPASRGGKAKTLTQGFAIGFYIFPMPHWFDPLNALLMGVAVILTLVTGFQYLKGNCATARVMNRIALVTVGDELLNGAVVDTSTAWLGDQLSLEGHALVISISVQDELSAISDAILSAIARADAVIVTGGLGPTSDDLTRLGVARAARVEVAQRKELVELITARYAARNMQVPSQALVMADIPIGASALTNNGGSAPGIFMEIDNVPLFALPGVPHEMRDMFLNEVLPELRQRFLGVRQHTFIVRVALLGESAVSESLRDWESNLPPGVSVAYLASLGDVEVKISSESARQAEEGATLAAELIGDSVYAIDEARALRSTLASAVLHLMREQDETLATVESLTGGGLAQLITDIPGASDVYLGGAVTYQAGSKHQLADVPEEMMRTRGTVDAQVAKAMARGIRLRLGASWGLATTGVAGPGDFEGQPAGTLYIGVSSPAGERAFKVVLSGQMADDRARVRRASAAHALDLFRRFLAGLPMGTKAGVITEE